MHPQKTFAIEQYHKIYYPKKARRTNQTTLTASCFRKLRTRGRTPTCCSDGETLSVCTSWAAFFYFASSSSWRGPPQNFSNYLLFLDHARHTFARYLIYDRPSFSPPFCPAAQQCSLENTIILARNFFFIVRKRFFTIFPVRWVLRALDLIGNYSQLRASFLLLCHYFCYSDSWEHLRPQFFQLVL